ncbi:MAG: hypothetical protein RMJ07_04935, partial [Nitrososphaerota archaeon]|nr:hypothetical protein [Nitrososphaerota archaeon]
FASLHAILYLMSFGLWRNWAIYLEPLEGIILGPYAGAFTALIGGAIARSIRPNEYLVFGIVAEPIGVLATGFLARGKWRGVLLLYAFMLLAYFMHPIGRSLPLWAIIDIIIALVLIYPIARMMKNVSWDNYRRLTIAIPLISFIGTVTDALARIFLLVPLNLYTIFGLTQEALYYVFAAGAIDSFIEDCIAIIISILVTVPIISAIRRVPAFRSLWPSS